jgi:hypothetical protein
MSTQPEVSVLIVAHDPGRFLEPAVASVLGQTHRDLELVLLDNGSSDDAVDRLAATIGDPRFRIIREPVNLGIAAGINRAFGECGGRLVAVMDQDDVCLPGRLASQVSWLRGHAESGGIASRTRLIDDEGREIGGDFTLHQPAEHLVFTAYSQAANFGSHLFRREVLEAFPRRKEFPFSSDFDFVARVSERWSVGALPEVLFEYRVHAGQATRVHRREQIAAEGVIRILTACRRAGRAEPIERVPEWLAEFLHIGSAADVHRAIAGRCLSLGVPTLAAYHARRQVGAEPGTRSFVRGLSILRRAVRLDPANAAYAVRLFFTGPLRTHGLAPWPAGAGSAAAR